MEVSVVLCPSCFMSLVASFPGFNPAFHHLQYEKLGEGPGIFPHMSDIRIKWMVERFNRAWAQRDSDQQEVQRYW